jgi:hypothetical protein
MVPHLQQRADNLSGNSVFVVLRYKFECLVSSCLGQTGIKDILLHLCPVVILKYLDLSSVYRAEPDKS